MSNENFQKWYSEAVKAGQEAANAKRPTPMIVAEHTNPLDDNSPILQSWNVPDGVCGFAWVNVKPGNSAFAKWLVKLGIARKDSYYGGVTIWIRDYNQSYERKLAHAEAMAKVLTAYGIRCYASGRLD